MGWKEWPSWVKGVLISLLCFLTILLFTVLIKLIDLIYVFEPGSFGNFLYLIENRIIGLMGFIPGMILNPSGSTGHGAFGISALLIWWPIDILQFVIIGAIIGWIVGKIKSKNQSKLNQNI